MKYTTLFEGYDLQKSLTFNSESAKFVLNGTINNESSRIPVDEDILSKHMLLLGGIGTGKSNSMYHLVRGIRQTMNNNDVMIIFDAKGDYYKKFYREGDIVLSNDKKSNVFWNIFNEIEIDSRVEENILEISKYLFSEKLKKSNQPFFPNAAKDLFAAMLLHIIRNETLYKFKNNKMLREIFNQIDIPTLKKILTSHQDLGSLRSYIEEEKSGQTLGVLSELQQMIREYFNGNFKKVGNFSIRETIRNKGSKVIFIEYDLGIGKMLSPIYGLIMDLAIKESLCRNSEEGNVFFVLDEFRLMSPLEHFDNGINFGRSLGAKFIAGLQNVEQMYDVYGETTAKSILSGFQTIFSFRVMDESSRKYVQSIYGKNQKLITYLSKIATKGIIEDIKDSDVIEDWDISKLDTGEAVISSRQYEPFVFKFREYK